MRKLLTKIFRNIKEGTDNNEHKRAEKNIEELNIPKRRYSINGDISSDIYILQEVHTYWETFYIDERGGENDYHRFDNEHDACVYFLEELKTEKKYLRYQNGTLTAGINREFQGEWRDVAMDEIEKAAKRGDASAMRAKKIIKRFGKKIIENERRQKYGRQNIYYVKDI